MNTESEKWMTDEEVDALLRAQTPRRVVLPARNEGYYHQAPDGE
jgi:hypothetical protein